MYSLLLVLSLCIDTFLASMAFGTDKIKIPFYLAFIINSISTMFLGISIFIGSLFKDFISPDIASSLSFYILIVLGIYRLFESTSKNFIKKFSNSGIPLTFKVFDFKFVLEIYADELKADYDKSKTLNTKEAIYLATALSLDSLAVGIGCSLGSVNYLEVLILSLIIGIFASLLGSFIGNRLVKSMNVNLSWLSGFLLIFLAILKK